MLGLRERVAVYDQVTADHPGIRKVWVDGGYRQHLVEHAAALGWCLAAGSTQRV